MCNEYKSPLKLFYAKYANYGYETSRTEYKYLDGVDCVKKIALSGRKTQSLKSQIRMDFTQ